MTRKELQNAIKSHLGRCFVLPFNEFNNLPELQALPRIQFSIKWMEMEEGANSNQKNGLHFCMPLAIAAQLNLPFDHATKDSVSADFVLPNTKFMRLIVLVSVLLVLHAPIYCHCHHIRIHFVSFFFHRLLLFLMQLSLKVCVTLIWSHCIFMTALITYTRIHAGCQFGSLPHECTTLL